MDSMSSKSNFHGSEDARKSEIEIPTIKIHNEEGEEEENSLVAFATGNRNNQLNVETHEPNSRCNKCCSIVRSFFKPCLRNENPLPSNPSKLQRFKYGLLCPPFGRFAKFLAYIILLFLIWCVLWSITKKEALPGGNFFSIFVLCICCICGGDLADLLKMPPLLGMLITGCLLRNVPGIKTIGESINQDWSSALRNLALIVILTRAGLGLDPVALKKLSFGVIRLAFIPCLVEALTVGVVSHFLLDLPWSWGFMLGFVLAAVSPAVVVPSLLNLKERGYGIDKGIPTLVIAAASVDDVLAITAFGLCVGIAFSEGSFGLLIAKGPLEAFGGVLFGVILGTILWFIPTATSKNKHPIRFIFLFGYGILAVFGSKNLDFAGAGALACLTIPFVAAINWRKDEGSDKIISEYFANLWIVFQPLLFGLIGAEIDITKIKSSTIGLGLAVLAIGLLFRVIASFLAVLRLGLNTKEKFFIPLAWLPKATVQAAIGSQALDITREKKLFNSVEEKNGLIILAVAVMVILVTAPVGAAAISISGPRLLKKQTDNSEENMNARDDEI
ncbi:DgyrCDS10862 [Dimorphilus gyrociliatus]|uniref:DgyrCDS10862 n=1 Tax=Dimorphilus gyrociliatus TaxID=2664684 RepID=A0A7I8W6L8_9ANNE|nr:DgyrCDS10862 [Dimorphilus gyrociliatus]